MGLIRDNYQWVFGGIGAAVLSGVAAMVKGVLRKPKGNQKSSDSNSNNNQNSVTINNFSGTNQAGQSAELDSISPEKEEELQRLTNIVFIDDDTKFKVVSILKNSGWIHTEAVKDVGSLTADNIKKAHIFFVDIQGVGLKLGCKDEGLGLAVILKREYPEKKLVIYSAEPQGNRFHEGLRVADDILSKNAEPYEFLHLVDQYSKEIFLK